MSVSLNLPFSSPEVMDYPRRNMDSFRGRRDFRWDQRFCVRRPEAYPAEDQHLLFDQQTKQNIAPTDKKELIDKFLGSVKTDLDPPCFIFDTLRWFLSSADIHQLYPHQGTHTQFDKLALIDDRRDLTGGPGYLDDLEMYKKRRNADLATLSVAERAALDRSLDLVRGTELRRNWNSKLYLELPPKGDEGHIFTDSLNEPELFDRLHGERLRNGAERRLIHVQNLTPLCGLALVATVSDYSAYLLRNYLERYLTLRVYFSVLMDKTIFAMEFHIPYLALRPGTRLKDKRVSPLDPKSDLRASAEMPEPMEGPSAPLFYYEAQVSFLIIGVDEWFWTAYCCSDSFFGSEQPPSSYAADGLDGPTGAAFSLSEPAWNPRDYFLRVFSARISQATKEWAVVVAKLQSRLESYEAAYNRSIESDRFFEDQETSNTKRYTKAVSTLRKFHDALLKTVEAWEVFAKEELHYFDTSCDGLHVLWTDIIASIFSDVSELRSLQRSIAQKIQTFDRMIDALVNVSALRESFFATTQGQKIGLLTNMTVLYLPFSLSASIFSMTMVNFSSRWLYYGITTISLVVLTIPWLFFNQLKHPDIGRSDTNRHDILTALRRSRSRS